MITGSLAAVVPLLAASGTVVAQCTSGPPYGEYVITGGNPLNVPLGNGDSVSLRLNESGGFRTVWVTGNGVGVFASGPFYTSIGPFYRALNFTPSNTVSPTGSTQATPYLCYNGVNFGILGNFCPPGPGMLVLRSTTDGALGWMELSVDTLTVNRAVVTIGIRGMQTSPVATVHPGNCASLPVELVSFASVVGADEVTLSWETASELNNAGFEVQRATRSEPFRKISFVEGHGTTTEGNVYRLTDSSVEANTHYRYRLKQIDFDGTTSFSEVVEVFTEDPSQIALSEFFPNPAVNGRATLKINLADAEEATVQVFDVRGALVDQRTEMLSAGENKLLFEMGQLAAGPHFAKVLVGRRALYREFVITR